MVDQEDQHHVFHPSSHPRRSSSASASSGTRKASSLAKTCGRVTIAFLAIVGCVILAGLSFVAYGGLKGFLNPTRLHALNPSQADSFAASSAVRPLFGPDDRFDVLATVWLDVTHHLDSGLPLPPSPIDGRPLRVVEYFPPRTNSAPRKEAILYSDVLFHYVSASDSKRHHTLPLRVPIAPLYTPHLGPSSLRATFAIVDRRPRAAAALKDASTVYYSGAPLLPRTPDLLNLTDDHVSTIDHALSRTGVSVSLLNLLESPWSRVGPPSDDNSTAASAFGASAAYTSHRSNMMFDAAPDNLSFLRNVNFSLDAAAATAQGRQQQPGRLPEFTDLNRTIFLPHIATRSRIALVRDDAVFNEFVFDRNHLEAASELRFRCALDIMNCRRPYDFHSYEQWVQLADATDTTADGIAAPLQRFYTPFLAHNPMASAPRHHRLVPSRAPASAFAGGGAVTSAADSPAPIALKRYDDDHEQCRVPVLDVDPTGQFFQFDWNVYFSAHSLRKAIFGEDLAKAVYAQPERHTQPLEYDAEGDEQLVAYGSYQEDVNWSMIAYANGDAPHPDARQTRNLIAGVLSMGVVVPVHFLLNFAFWYTRTTTAGIYTDAHWIAVAAVGLQIIVQATDPNTWSDLDPVSAIFGGAWWLIGYAYVPWMLMTLLRLRRPSAVSGGPGGSGRRKRRGGWRQWLGLQQRPRSRRERESLRVERAEIGTGKLAALAITVVTVFLLSSRLDVTLRRGLGCREMPPPGAPSMSRTDAIRAGVLDVTSVLFTVVQLGQLAFNWAHGTFAGEFRLSAWLSFGSLVALQAFDHLASLSGHAETRDPLMLSHLVELLVSAVAAYQAFWFGGVVQKRDEEEEEEDEGWEGHEKR